MFGSYPVKITSEVRMGISAAKFFFYYFALPPFSTSQVITFVALLLFVFPIYDSTEEVIQETVEEC
jgi:hypothetical protein